MREVYQVAEHKAALGALGSFALFWFTIPLASLPQSSFIKSDCYKGTAIDRQLAHYVNELRDTIQIGNAQNGFDVREYKKGIEAMLESSISLKEKMQLTGELRGKT